MYLFYIIALLPAIIGCLLFIFNKKISWKEWVGGTIIAFLTSAIIHGIAFYGVTADQETWSGKIIKVAHFPQWREEYRQRHTQIYYTGSGKNRRSHTRVWYTTEHATHPEHWVAYANYGEYSENKNIGLPLFNEIKSNFGGKIENGGKQSCSHGGHFDGGDNNIYATHNVTGYIYPVTCKKYFENRIKAAPSVFSFVKVPSDAPVYPWPENPDWMHSGRLIGVNGIDLRKFDIMNSNLGPTKKINLIMIGFNSPDSMLGQLQEAAWIGGRKNDLVLCYGYEGTNVLWSSVFGWSEKEICKRNLETLILNNPINNEILPLISKEIVENYTKKEWKKFSYISIDPPRWSYITLFIVMFITQGLFWIWAHVNEFTKEGFRDALSKGLKS